MLYDKPGNVFYRMADGKSYSHEMEEGANQGCPLSATLAALLLHEVLGPLTVKLNARAFVRWCANNIYDDEAGGQTHPMGYIDDVCALVSIEDVLFFLEEFERLGVRLG